jgi:hypothetical protein
MMDTEYIRNEAGRVVFEIKHVFDIARQWHLIEVRSQLLEDRYQVSVPTPDYNDHRERWFPIVMVPSGYGYKGVIVAVVLPEDLTIREVMFAIKDGTRLVDAIDGGLNELLGRDSTFARLVEIYFGARGDVP